MRIVLTLLLVLRGIAHLPGFLVPWRLAAPPVGWPDSRIGVAVNLLILGYLLAGGRAGWLPGAAGPGR